MGIESRLKKLEATHRHGMVCSECGTNCDGSPQEIELKVVGPEIRDFTKPAPPIDTSKDLCSKCGARVIYRITAPPTAGERGPRKYSVE